MVKLNLEGRPISLAGIAYQTMVTFASISRVVLSLGISDPFRKPQKEAGCCVVVAGGCGGFSFSFFLLTSPYSLVDVSSLNGFLL